MDSNDLRDSLFNTINLLNDMEAGVETQPRDKNKDVELSSTFVNGIKEKLVNPNKVLEKTQDTEKLNNLQHVMEQQLLEVHKALQSQARVITALKDEIAVLKEKQKEEAVVQQPEQPVFHSQEPQQSFVPKEEPMFHQEQQQMLSPEPEFMSEPEPSFISQNAPPPEPVQQPVACQTNDYVQPQQPVAQPAPSPEPQPAPQPKESNPRVGNYNSSDVAIEKYFYFGNK
jgi:hypothetical protein